MDHVKTICTNEGVWKMDHAFTCVNATVVNVVSNGYFKNERRKHFIDVVLYYYMIIATYKIKMYMFFLVF